MTDYTVKNFKSIIRSRAVQACGLIDQEHLSMEYYHLYKNHSLYIDCESTDQSLYYLVLKGSVEMMFETEKVQLHEGDLIQIDHKKIFDIYALEETSLFFITSSGSNINKKLDELTEQVKEEEKRDPYTKGHNYRVGKYATAIMHYMNPDYHSNDLSFAGSYHDVGKAKVNMEILNKRGRLTPEEWKEIQMHPVYTYEMLLPILGEKIAFIAKCHHEKLDGTGYPSRLKEDKIPLEAQILSVADIFDALTSRRAYHNPLSAKDAINVLKKDVAAHKLNGEAVDALEKLVELQMIDPTSEMNYT